MDNNDEKACASSSNDTLAKPQCESDEAAASAAGTDLHDKHEDDNDNDNGIFINLTVPPGAEPGVDSLTFEYDGDEMEVLVPPGSVAGDVLRIQVGATGGSTSNSNADADAKESKPSSSSGLMDELGGIMNNDNDIDSESKAKAISRDKNKNPSSASGGLLSEMGGMKHEPKSKNTKSQTETKVTSRDLNTNNCSTDGITIVELGNGLIQQSQNDSDTKKEQSVTTATSLQLLESIPGTASEGDGTHGMVWSSGLFLAQALTSSPGLKYLSKLVSRSFDNKNGDKKESRILNCLELGSGLGVCGLALAHALATCFKTSCTSATSGSGSISARILLSDQGEKVIELLKENIRRNLPPSSGSDNDQCIKIEAQSLSWGDDVVLPSTPTPSQCSSDCTDDDERFHLILGSDLLYNTRQSYDPLIKTIKHHLHPEQGIILLAVRWRKPDFERDFFERAEKEGLKFELWKELLVEDEDDEQHFAKRSPCRLNWREYGNPECDSSNRYFHETTISVANTEMPLAKIGEQDLEFMNDEEYAKFEELQVQIYVGRFEKEEVISRKRQRIHS